MRFLGRGWCWSGLMLESSFPCARMNSPDTARSSPYLSSNTITWAILSSYILSSTKSVARFTNLILSAIYFFWIHQSMNWDRKNIHRTLYPIHITHRYIKVRYWWFNPIPLILKMNNRKKQTQTNKEIYTSNKKVQHPMRIVDSLCRKRAGMSLWWATGRMEFTFVSS